MSAPWFNTPERIAALEAAALSWIGTPWAQNSRVKGAGGGVSCHFLPYEIVREAGLLLPFDPPKAPADWSINHKESIIEPFMDARPEFASVADMAPGDFNGYLVGGCLHHLTVVLTGGRMVHVWRNTGVIISRVDDTTYSKRHKRTWRPIS